MMGKSWAKDKNTQQPSFTRMLVKCISKTWRPPALYSAGKRLPVHPQRWKALERCLIVSHDPVATWPHDDNSKYGALSIPILINVDKPSLISWKSLGPGGNIYQGYIIRALDHVRVVRGRAILYTARRSQLGLKSLEQHRRRRVQAGRHKWIGKIRGWKSHAKCNQESSICSGDCLEASMAPAQGSFSRDEACPGAFVICHETFNSYRALWFAGEQEIKNLYAGGMNDVKKGAKVP
ncbi:hypothetical protein BDP27DRAFT_1367166 [Rhodocollybia butyracea]|uniref:Uncharacterized protein n=1 Tax=Rhodocollybia butyracea TaxID=206335 RepID=A0A9P5PJR6_9AGAR|nr:hypothetical protein BDP27DRAFT_1367166 [Rhodocollybia butyracea]